MPNEFCQLSCCPRSKVSNYMSQLPLCTLQALHTAALVSADTQVQEASTY